MTTDDWWASRLKANPKFDFTQYLGDQNVPSRLAARELAISLGIKSVLDVGCGPAIDRWIDTGVEWHGVDESYLVSDINHDRGISIDQAPASVLPYTAGAFDLVYSRHLWEHLPGFVAPLREACRVARKAVMITFFRPPGLVERFQMIDGTRYNDYRLADIRAEFERCWPQCKLREIKLGLPFGETILYVEKEP